MNCEVKFTRPNNFSTLIKLAPPVLKVPNVILWILSGLFVCLIKITLFFWLGVTKINDIIFPGKKKKVSLFELRLLSVWHLDCLLRNVRLEGSSGEDYAQINKFGIFWSVKQDCIVIGKVNFRIFILRSNRFQPLPH